MKKLLIVLIAFSLLAAVPASPTNVHVALAPGQWFSYTVSGVVISIVMVQPDLEHQCVLEVYTGLPRVGTYFGEIHMVSSAVKVEDDMFPRIYCIQGLNPPQAEFISVTKDLYNWSYLPYSIR